jgi:hypothetical protein
MKINFKKDTSGTFFVWFTANHKYVRMFRAVKNPLEVEVTFDGQNVSVKPLHVTQAEGLVSRTLARCEEFLAQTFLQEQPHRDTYRSLVNFFKGRGWYIKESISKTGEKRPAF